MSLGLSPYFSNFLGIHLSHNNWCSEHKVLYGIRSFILIIADEELDSSIKIILKTILKKKKNRKNEKKSVLNLFQ